MKPRTFKNSYGYILVIIAVIVVVSTVLKPRSGDDTGNFPSESQRVASNSRTAGWILCGIPIFTTIGFMVMATTQQRKLQSHIDQRRFVELPELRGLTPPGAQPAIDILTTAGFTRIGEAAMYLPKRKDPDPAPILLSPDKHILAFVTTYGEPPQPRVAFETAFADGFLVYTNYPYGTTVSRPFLRTSVQTASIEAALAQHTSHVAEIEHQHGAVYLVASMNDRSAWWTAFERLHKNDASLINNPVKWLATPLIIMIISAIAWNTSLLPSPIGTWVGFGGLILLIGWLAWNIKQGVITFNRR